MLFDCSLKLVDSVVDKAVAGCAPSTAHPILGPGAAIGDSAAFAAAAATAAATAAAQDSTDISGVSTALDWWEKKAADLDEEYYRVAAEGKRWDWLVSTLSTGSLSVVVLAVDMLHDTILLQVDHVHEGEASRSPLCLPF